VYKINQAGTIAIFVLASDFADDLESFESMVAGADGT
jgi:hypothetical protein